MPHALRLRTATASPHDLVLSRPLDRGLRAWWHRNVVAMDPHPEAGRLDRLDQPPVASFDRSASVADPVRRVA